MLLVNNLPKINVVFSNALKARSCIAKQIYDSKKNSLQKKKQNTCFEMPFLLQILTLLLFTYDLYKSKIHILVNTIKLALMHMLYELL